MQFEELETERLNLLNISNSDRDFIHHEFSNDFINKYLFDAEPVKTKAEAQEIVDFYTLPEPRNHHRWILVLKHTDIKIGTCGFHCIDDTEKYLEIGYDLLEEYNNKGYMHEALNAIIAFATKKMKIETMEGHVYFENINSLKLLEKLGFSNEGEMYLELNRKKYKHYILRKKIV